MRAALQWLYRGSGLLAGFFLVAIAVLSLAQIVARELGLPASSLDEFAGYCLAASSFLGLAWTFREDEHIRMTLAVQLARGLGRRALETATLAIAAFLVGTFAWYACDMTLTSYRLGDVSQGLVPVPLWIPQSGMALGLAVMFIAVADDLVQALRGAEASYDAAARRKESGQSGAVARFER
jgi:TRAP-type C4-dicarboxylate transport system permease small subunit